MTPSTMRRTTRRIEKLEELIQHKEAAKVEIFRQALARFRFATGQIEPLIRAIAAEREGRPFAERERLARQAFWREVQRECETKQVPVPEKYPSDLASYALYLELIFDGEFDALRSILEAQQEGRQPAAKDLPGAQATLARHRQRCDLLGCDPIFGRRTNTLSETRKRRVA